MERGIIFSGESVRAILEGRKTQTRRLFFALNGSRPTYGKGYPKRAAAWEGDTNAEGWPLYSHMDHLARDASELVPVPCPFGEPGDRLWVRETWRVNIAGPGPTVVEYKAGGSKPCLPSEAPVLKKGQELTWRSPLFLPQRLARLVVSITAVRVERLHDIAEADAQAEGVEADFGNAFTYAGRDYRRSFERAWNELNGKRAPWSSNPWIWVISFSKESP